IRMHAGCAPPLPPDRRARHLHRGGAPRAPLAACADPVDPQARGRARRAALRARAPRRGADRAGRGAVAARACRAGRRRGGLARGEVRIGAGGTACTYLLPPIVAAFRREHPSVRFLLRETAPDEALAALEAGELDLAAVTADHGELWFMDALVLVAAPGTKAR